MDENLGNTIGYTGAMGTLYNAWGTMLAQVRNADLAALGLRVLPGVDVLEGVEKKLLDSGYEKWVKSTRLMQVIGV